MNEEKFPLYKLKPGQKGRVVKFNNSPQILRRLMDLGLIIGSEIECKIISPLGNPKAYMICGALIALRNDEAGRIEVVFV